MLTWKKPPDNMLKLNIDCSRNGQNGKIAAGGIIRNSSGLWVHGFHANLGIGEVLDAETWGLFLGLKLASECSVTNLIAESDSAILVNSLLNDLHPLGSLLSCCKSFSNSSAPSLLIMSTGNETWWLMSLPRMT